MSKLKLNKDKNYLKANIDTLKNFEKTFVTKNNLNIMIDLHFDVIENAIKSGSLIGLIVDNELVGFATLYEHGYNYQLVRFFLTKENELYRNAFLEIILKDYLLIVLPNLFGYKEYFEKSISKFTMAKYINDHTNTVTNYILKSDNYEETFFIIKPDGIKYFPKIKEAILGAGFKFIGIQSIPTSSVRDKLDIHYSHIVDKPFYKDVVEYMTTGDSLIIGKLFKANAVEDFRKLIGPTNPDIAPKGTIRGDFGKVENGKIYNVVHGSDSVENAQKEIEIWFGKD